MNAREQFQRLMNYQPVDRIPVLAIENYHEPSAVERWRKEGLPEGKSAPEYLGMDTIRWIPVHMGPAPAFERRTLEENATEFVEQDYMGCIVRRKKEAPAMYYGYIEHPVKTRQDWERYKQRFDPRSPDRWPPDWKKTLTEIETSGMPVGLHLFPYFFRLGFYSMGMERFLTAFHEEPDLIHDMFSFWSDFAMELIRPVFESGTVRVDCFTFTEDMAYKNGPHVSPRIYEEFWLPHQTPLLRLAQAHSVPTVSFWSAGNLHALLPLLMKNGINCTWPVERGSGMDPAALRKKFGRGLRLGGGISKEAMVAGPSAIDREIAELLPLIKEGGFLPALDDVVPPETPLAHYQYYVRALRAIRL
jgi:uroporphyrinogen decarboxylase